MGKGGADRQAVRRSGQGILHQLPYLVYGEPLAGVAHQDAVPVEDGKVHAGANGIPLVGHGVGPASTTARLMSTARNTGE